MKLTLNDIKSLAAKGKIRGYKEGVQVSRKNILQENGKNIPTGKGAKQKAWIRDQLLQFCERRNFELAEEYQFHPVRKWRFDFAIVNLKVAVEYEGIFSEKSRHTTVTGFTGDATKYNTAVADGWDVYRLTAKNYKSLTEIIEKWEN